MTSVTRLADYTSPNWTIAHTSLHFKLDPTQTHVITRITFEKGQGDLRLDGENLTLCRLLVDRQNVPYHLDQESLVIAKKDLPAGTFTLETEIIINPQENTALEGLYMSNGMYCTQCEAEGFRKITYYPDRPDVMAPFDVRIDSDLPVLLSNGNLLEQGKGYVKWQDPWPKPSYLFALVAGDLVAFSDHFVTLTGRKVALNIWVRSQDQGKCAYAMDALKRSMAWDEQVYGREYDLDIFNIVAVDDFNMGAMENKGLNIFNAKYVLLSPETATDRDYELVEAIIAHEYFHNWTGNRITCRDWFQLCLKEGLTVFRDQQFSADMRDPAIKRIEDVLQLRSRQFREDAGPLAHPVRPEAYKEINNFYTATVYEKGAELIRMLRILVGPDTYDKALNLYFTRHDGQAATIEEWLQVFADVTGQDLGLFMRWYQQAGTPQISMQETYADGGYAVTFRQDIPPTPNQPHKDPMLIPIAFGLLDYDGTEIVPTQILELTQREQKFTFSGLSQRPVASVLRNFSAPVILKRAISPQDQALLLAHDTDPFNKWEAGYHLAKNVLCNMIQQNAPVDSNYITALGSALTHPTGQPAFKALLLGLPSEDVIAETLYDLGHTPDPLAIHAQREKLKHAIAHHHADLLKEMYHQNTSDTPYNPSANQAQKRQLRNTCLSLLSLLDGGILAQSQYDQANNMTDMLAAFACLLTTDKRDPVIADFYQKWRQDKLVIDKWFGLQITYSAPDETVDSAQALTQHSAFQWKNPNTFRSVFGALSAHVAGFHHPSGRAYDLLADWLIRLDSLNPQTTARMTQAFETWPRYDVSRQKHIKQALERIYATQGLSKDTSEMIERLMSAS